jgi:hypothetical protein
MPSFGSGSDSQASLLTRLHLTGAYLVTNGFSQRVNCPFLPNLFVRVWALRKFHFSLRSDRARINPIRIPSSEATPASCRQLASPAAATRRSGVPEQNVRLAASCDRAPPHHDRERGPTWETHYAKVDHYDSVAGPGRHFGGDCAAGWFVESSRTPINELGPAIAAGGTGGTPPAARRPSALGEKPDESE